MSDIVIRDLFLGFIPIHVLHHAAIEPVYGLALMDELRAHGYAVGPGTVYPMLHSLERSGLLTRDDRLVLGKVRKYYSITDAGQRALANARRGLRELVAEVLGPDTER